MRHPTKQQPAWICALRHRSVWKRAGILGLTVGALQAALNQGDHWANHSVNGIIVVKTIACPLITFLVALASSASAWVQK